MTPALAYVMDCAIAGIVIGALAVAVMAWIR